MAEKTVLNTTYCNDAATSLPYLHNNIAEEEVEEKLRTAGEGSFLVTPVENYCLYVRNRNTVNRFRIQKRRIKFVIGGRLFDSLDDIVERYKENNILEGLFLKDPITRNDADPNEKLYFYPNLDPTDVLEKLTNEKIGHGDFLVSPVEDGDYCLHFFCNNLIQKFLLDKQKDGQFLFGGRNFDSVAAVIERYKTSQLVQGFTLKTPVDRLSSEFAAIPLEIRRMDEFSIQLFKDALKKGKRKIYRIRIMIVGHLGVGKTTLTKGLLGELQKITSTGSTDGIEIYIGRCLIDLKKRIWLPIDTDAKDTIDIYKEIGLILSGINIKDYQVEADVLEPGYTDQVSNDSAINTENSKDSKNSAQLHGEGLPVIETENSAVVVENISLPTLPQLLELAISRASTTSLQKDRASVDIWDFGGQSVFYNTHQTFLSWRCIYFLAFDASKDIEDTVEDESLTGDSVTQSVVLEYILFWINSIITYAKGRFSGFPKILLIATHLDQISKDQRNQHISNLFSKIEKCLSSHPGRNHLIINPVFSLNALNEEDSGYALIREEVLKTSESHPLWGEERPTSWLPLEEHLMRMKETGAKILSIENVKQINDAALIQSLSHVELILFLQFQHSLGHLLYFKDKNLCNFVILDPKFLIDALRSIITAERFCRVGKHKKQLWKKLSEEGLLEIDLLCQVWANEEYVQFSRFQDHLIKTMEKLDLLAKPKMYSVDMDDQVSQNYFVPCMIKTKVPEDIYECVIGRDRMVGLIICFKGKFLPVAIFMRLLASCVTMWPLTRMKNKNLIYSSFASFTLDSHHILLIQRDNHKILVNIVHDEKFDRISVKLCIGIRHFVSRSLDRIIESYDHTFDDELFEKKSVYMEDTLYDIHVPCCVEHTQCYVLCDAKGNTHNCAHHGESKRSSLWFVQPVEKTCHVSKECGSDCKGPSTADLSSVITEQHIGRLSRYLKTTPSSLAAALEIDTEDLMAIQYDSFYGLHEQNFLLLFKWKERIIGETGESPVFESLKEIIDLVGDNTHVICKVKKERDKYGSKAVSGFLKEKIFAQPKDIELDELADRLQPRQCYQLCIELGVHHAQLDQIRHDFPNKSLIQMRESLKYWKRKACHRVKMGELAAALDETRIYSSVLREVIDDNEETTDDSDQ